MLVDDGAAKGLDVKSAAGWRDWLPRRGFTIRSSMSPPDIAHALRPSVDPDLGVLRDARIEGDALWVGAVSPAAFRLRVREVGPVFCGAISAEPQGALVRVRVQARADYFMCSAFGFILSLFAGGATVSGSYGVAIATGALALGAALVLRVAFVKHARHTERVLRGLVKPSSAVHTTAYR